MIGLIVMIELKSIIMLSFVKILKMNEVRLGFFSCYFLWDEFHSECIEQVFFEEVL